MTCLRSGKFRIIISFGFLDYVVNRLSSLFLISLFYQFQHINLNAVFKNLSNKIKKVTPPVTKSVSLSGDRKHSSSSKNFVSKILSSFMFNKVIHSSDFLEEKERAFCFYRLWISNILMK